MRAALSSALPPSPALRRSSALPLSARLGSRLHTSSLLARCPASSTPSQPSSDCNAQRLALQVGEAPARRGARRMCTGPSSLSSPSGRAQAEEGLLKRLRSKLEPSLVRVRQLAVHASGDVDVGLELSTAAYSHEEARECAMAVLREFAWVGTADVKTSARPPISFMGLGAPASLQQVGALVGVSSCKGGVGKSTVAVNLAFALAELGGRVGLLDADIYGPSLPSLVTLPPNSLPLLQRAETKLLQPAMVGGVKLMSYGFVAKGASRGELSAAVMRGPMVSKVMTQLLSGTDWGQLDYLLVDLPPGTGDIQLSLCQTYSLTGAVVVTTPQRLSRVDVLKGIDMWDELKVPVLSVMENMAYFKDPRGEVHHLFGKSQLHRMLQSCKLPSEAAFQLPIEVDVNSACDEGIPVVVHKPMCETATVMRKAAKALVIEVARLRDPAGAHKHQQIRLDPARGLVLRVLLGPDEGSEYVLPLSEVASLGGLPTSTSKRVPSSVDLVAARGGGKLDAGESRSVVCVRWNDGVEALVTTSAFIRRARAIGFGPPPLVT